MITGNILKMFGFPLAKETFFQLDLFGLPDIISYILTSPTSLRCVTFNLKLPAPDFLSELQLFYPKSTCTRHRRSMKNTYILRMDVYQHYNKSKLPTRTHERLNGELLFHVDLFIPSLNLKSAKKSMFVSFTGSPCST